MWRIVVDGPKEVVVVLKVPQPDSAWVVLRQNGREVSPHPKTERGERFGLLWLHGTHNEVSVTSPCPE